MIKRPWIGFFLAFVLGELLGIKLDKVVLLVLFVLAILLCAFLRYIKVLRNFVYLIFIIFFLAGSLRTVIFIENNRRFDKVNGLKENIYIKDYNLDVKNTTLRESKLLIEGERLMLVSNDTSIKKGDSILVSGKLEKISSADNYGNFDAKVYYLSRNIAYNLKVKKVKILKRGKSISELVKSKCSKKLLLSLANKEAGLMIAILLGDRAYLDKDLYKLFKDNGIAHILAISGLHISLIGVGVYNMLRKKVKLSYFYSGFIASLILFFYADIVGESASVYRAVAMLILAFISALRGRDYDLLTSLSFVAILLCAKNPYIIFQTSFILSFMAVFSIGISNYYIAKPLNEIFFYKESKRERLKTNIINSLSISLGIQVISLPIIAYYFFYIPSYAICLNTLILPFMSILCISGFILFLPNIWGLSTLSKMNISFILYIYENLCHLFSLFYKSKILLGRVGIIRFCIYYIILFIPIIILNLKVDKYRRKIKYKYNYLIFIFIGFILSISILLYRVRTHNEIFFLDIKKGFCNYMSENGNNIMVDIRGQRLDSSLEPFLLAKAVNNIDFLFLSDLKEEDSRNILDLLKREEIKISKIIIPAFMRNSNICKKLERSLSAKGIDFAYIGENTNIKFKDDIFYYKDENLIFENKDFKIYFKGELRRVLYKNKLRYVILGENKTESENTLSTYLDTCLSIRLDKNSCEIRKFRREDESFKRRYKK